MKKIILGTLLLVGAAQASVNLNSCVGCHGADFGKSALGKSKIVRDMTKKEVTDALLGYKNGSYGGPMKGLMKRTLVKYSTYELSNTGIGRDSDFKR